MSTISKRHWSLVIAVLLIGVLVLAAARFLPVKGKSASDPRLLKIAAQAESLVSHHLESLEEEGALVRYFCSFGELARKRWDPVYSHDPVPYAWIVLDREARFAEGRVPVRINVPTNANGTLVLALRLYPNEEEVESAVEGRIVVRRGKLLLGSQVTIPDELMG